MLFVESVLLLTAGMLVTIGGHIPRDTARSSLPRITEGKFLFEGYLSLTNERQKTPNFRCTAGDLLLRIRCHKFPRSFRDVLDLVPAVIMHKKHKDSSESKNFSSAISMHFSEGNRLKTRTDVNNGRMLRTFSAYLTRPPVKYAKQVAPLRKADRISQYFEKFRRDVAKTPFMFTLNMTRKGKPIMKHTTKKMYLNVSLQLQKQCSDRTNSNTQQNKEKNMEKNRTRIRRSSTQNDGKNTSKMTSLNVVYKKNTKHKSVYIRNSCLVKSACRLQIPQQLLLFRSRRNVVGYPHVVRQITTRSSKLKNLSSHRVASRRRRNLKEDDIKKCNKIHCSGVAETIFDKLKTDIIKYHSPIVNQMQNSMKYNPSLAPNSRRILFFGFDSGLKSKRMKRESATGSSNSKASRDPQKAGHQREVFGEIPKVHKMWEIVSSAAASMEKKKNDSLRGLHDTSGLNALSNSTLVFGGEKEIWNRPRGPHSGEVSAEISADDEGKRLSVLPPDGALVDFPHHKAKGGANDDKNGAILHHGPALIIHEPERNDDEDDDDTVVTSSEAKDPAGGDSGVSADSSEFDPSGNRWISDGAYSVTEIKSSSRDESYNDTTAGKQDEKCSHDAKLCGENLSDQQDLGNIKNADKNSGIHDRGAAAHKIHTSGDLGTRFILKSIKMLNDTNFPVEKSTTSEELPDEKLKARDEADISKGVFTTAHNQSHTDNDANTKKYLDIQTESSGENEREMRKQNSDRIKENPDPRTTDNKTGVEYFLNEKDVSKIQEKSKSRSPLRTIVSFDRMSSGLLDQDSKFAAANQEMWEVNTTFFDEKLYTETTELSRNKTLAKVHSSKTPDGQQFNLNSDNISAVSLNKTSIRDKTGSDIFTSLKGKAVKPALNSSQEFFITNKNLKFKNETQDPALVKNSSTTEKIPKLFIMPDNNHSRVFPEYDNYDEKQKMLIQHDSGFIENVVSTGKPSKEDVFREFYASKRDSIRHYAMLNLDVNPHSGKRTVKRNSTSSTDSPSTTTTPDPHMNDPPFVRGPNISPEVELFSKKEKDESKKSLHPLDPIIEPPRFQTSSQIEWRWAKNEWGIAWDCHCYISGVVFLIVAVYSFVSLLRVKTFVRLLSLGYFVAINVLVLFGSAARALYLLHDPYNSSNIYPQAVSHMLFNIALPCLSSAFAVLFLALLQSTKTQLLPPNLQRPHYLAILVVFHFSFAATCDIVSSVFIGSKVFLLISCHIVFLMWCLLTSVSFFCVFRRAHRAALRKQGEMIRITFTKMHIDGADLPKKLPKPTLGLAVKVAFASAVLQVVFCCLFPYGVDTLELVYPHVKKLSPWLWWTYHLLCRILEQSLFLMISFTATQPLKHFEIGDNRFCNVLLWLPCSSFADFCQKEEVVDFEAHSDNYANLQGFRNCGFIVPATARRLQTNSLPTFRTPVADIDNTLPMRNLPYSGRTRNTNHPSALSLLSYYRSKRNLSLSTNGGLGDLERTIGSHGTLPSVSACRPASMLYKDNGFIRFRTDGDPHQPMELSDEDDRAVHEDPDTSAEDADSTRAIASSSIQSLLEDDIVQGTLSPFFRLGFSHRFRKMSRISIETTDNSVNVSSEQLSNIGRLSGSALDFSSHKHGSSCSSESAANSFDVTFYLHHGNSPSVVPQLDTPSSAHAYRSEAEEDKTSSVEGHEVLLRSVSPIVKRSMTRRLHELPLNLNLSSAGESGLHCGHVNVACGTEDITPDSAVYLDLQLSKDPEPSGFQPPRDPIPFGLTIPPPPIFSFSDSLTPSSEDTSPSNGTPLGAYPKPNTVTATSQSLSDLRTSNSYVATCRSRRTSRGLLNKLRGSTFSLNAAFNGYEPLEPKNTSCYYPNATYHHSKRKLRRVSSDRRSGEELQTEGNPTPLVVFRDRCVGSSAAHLGDSGLLGDCPEWGVTQVDVASQTDPALEYYDTSSNTCDTYSVSSSRSPMSLASSGTVGVGK